MALQFTYAPTANAIAFSVGGTLCAVDLVSYSTGVGELVELAIYQQSGGHYDYLGNAPGAPAADGNIGLMWQLNASDGAVLYIPPAGGAGAALPPLTTAPNFYQCVNYFGVSMVSDWIAKINATIATVFGVAPVAPPEAPGTFTDATDAFNYLAGLLKGYQYASATSMVVVKP